MNFPHIEKFRGTLPNLDFGVLWNNILVSKIPVAGHNRFDAGVLFYSDYL